MRIIFHERYNEVYTTDPAAAAGRMEATMGVLGRDSQFVTPPPAVDGDLALVLDSDLHFGDGTANAFIGNPDADCFYPEGPSNKGFIQKVERHLERSEDFDILAVSAGFDRHVEGRGDCWQQRITGRSAPWSRSIPKRSVGAAASGSWRAATTTRSWDAMCGPLWRG